MNFLSIKQFLFLPMRFLEKSECIFAPILLN